MEMSTLIRLSMRVLPGKNQHTHDTDKSVADVASHEHLAGSILDHAHAATGRREIDALDDANHQVGGNVHTHVSAGAKVDPKAHTHDGHKGDHGHPAPEADGAPAVAALPPY